MRGKDAVKQALRVIGGAIPRDSGRRVVVLCYHSIHPTLPFSSATPELFRDQLSWLLENCECVPFSEVLEPATQGLTDRPTVSVTFDDGYADNHDFALPLLVESGIRATFFITVGFVDGDLKTLERFRQLRSTDAASIRPLVWEQLREMMQAGMEVGAHSYSHPNLARLSDEVLAYEMTHPRRILEDRLGFKVRMMAYPFGRAKVHFNHRVVEAARQAGYTLAGTTVTRGLRRSDHPLSVPRMFATRDSVESLRDKVFGRWDLIGAVRERAPLTVAKLLSPADFEF